MQATKSIKPTYELLDPRTLTPHPLNWAEHGPEQRAGLRAGAAEFGLELDPPLVNRRTGRVVDGHLRREQAIADGLEALPCLVIDVSERVERRILASLDRVAEMRGRDNARLLALLRECQADEAGEGLPPGWSEDNLKELLETLSPEPGEGNEGKGQANKYVIEFDSAEQLGRWLLFLGYLGQVFDNEPSVGGRIAAFVTTLEAQT